MRSADAPKPDALKPCRVWLECSVVIAAVQLGCGGDADADRWVGSRTLAECGTSLDALLATRGDAEPSFDAGYSEALAAWALEGGGCGLGVFAGQCADGKRLLYRNGGFVSEIRYFDGEQLVGYVGSSDIAVCPSVCPSSRYYGDLGSVRCDAPVFESLCEGSSPAADGVWMPFADGQAPGGCDPL